MQYKYHRAIGISALTLLMIMMMFSADYIYMNAWALSIRTVNNTDNTTAITRVGSQIWVASESGNTVRVWTTSGVLLASISATDVHYLFNYAGKVYGFSGSNTVLYEFDPLNPNGGIIRTSSALTGCLTTVQFTFDSDGRFFCGTGASNTIKMVNLSTFVVTTSSTVNTGANACNVIAAMTYDSVADALILGCNTSDNVVVIEDVATSGTPDYGTGFSPQWGTLAWDNNNQIAWGASSVTDDTALYQFDVDTTLNTIALTATHTRSASTVDDTGIAYDSQGDRVMVWGQADVMDVIDASTGSIIISVSGMTCLGGNGCKIEVYNNIFVYTTGDANVNYYEVDLTGVSSGGGGGGVVPASICYIDTNADGVANLVYHDTTGPNGVPDGMCDGSVLDFPENDPADCTANGLARLIASLLGIDCDSDPNPSTNGIGMLYMLFLGLFVMGVIFAGSRKFNFDMASVHPAVWLFFAVGITGFSWQVGWVDSIVFYAMIIVSAGVGAFGLYQKIRNSGG